jgi:hypothetical protein
MSFPPVAIETSTVLPGYWIERPPFRAGRATQAAVDSFLQLVDASGGGRVVDVDTFLREAPRVVRWPVPLQPGHSSPDRVSRDGRSAHRALRAA